MTASAPSVTLAATLHRSADVMQQVLGDEIVLLDMKGEQYFGLDPVGARIWTLLDGQRNLGDVLATLHAEYDADPDAVRTDLLLLAKSLLDAGLVAAAR